MRPQYANHSNGLANLHVLCLHSGSYLLEFRFNLNECVGGDAGDQVSIGVSGTTFLKELESDTMPFKEVKKGSGGTGTGRDA
jgi:hypothetical protein